MSQLHNLIHKQTDSQLAVSKGQADLAQEPWTWVPHPYTPWTHHSPSGFAGPIIHQDEHVPDLSRSSNLLHVPQTIRKPSILPCLRLKPDLRGPVFHGRAEASRRNGPAPRRTRVSILSPLDLKGCPLTIPLGVQVPPPPFLLDLLSV